MAVIIPEDSSIYIRLLLNTSVASLWLVTLCDASTYRLPACSGILRTINHIIHFSNNAMVSKNKTKRPTPLWHSRNAIHLGRVTSSQIQSRQIYKRAVQRQVWGKWSFWWKACVLQHQPSIGAGPTHSCSSIWRFVLEYAPCQKCHTMATGRLHEHQVQLSECSNWLIVAPQSLKNSKTPSRASSSFHWDISLWKPKLLLYVSFIKWAVVLVKMILAVVYNMAW